MEDNVDNSLNINLILFALVLLIFIIQFLYKHIAKIMQTVKDELEKNNAKKKLKSYNYTHRIGNYIAINEKDKTWSPFPYQKIYKFIDLIDYEIIENNQTIYSSISSKGTAGIGRAVIGGILFGGVGAVVGASTAKSKIATESSNIIESIKIKITINDMNIRNIIIDMGYNGLAHSKEATTIKSYVQDIVSALDIIKNSNLKSNSQYDEIIKFKNLLDNGAITQEEYEVKKKQILQR